MQQNQPDAAVREFKAVVALKPVDPAARYTDLAESYFKSGKRAEARKQTLAALEIAPSYERAQDLLLKLVGGRGRDECGGSGCIVARRAAVRARARRCSRGSARSCRRSPTIASPACSGASSASSITSSPRTRRVQQDFYGEPWLIDGPAAEQNLSRRIKTATSIDVAGSDRADARRSAALHVSVDLLRRAGQPEADRQRRRRPCASSCCAAARRPSTTSTVPSSGTTSPAR